ncbi:ubiquitin-like-specific protease 1D [Quillaja saponaria]|uniref:Ubiquitin-like-specific protease 1D n=1 Tax=Quillaja saponaria TaxID=32244 RepID=A0AAD7KRI1_QUISA|nr:ubiquitin-like-specific protease 1D [Quillaja saponaria]
METKKRPLNLDWDALIPSQEEEPPVVVIVKPTATTTITEPQTHSDMDTDQQYSQTEAIEHFSDHKLEESIRSKRNTLLTTAMNLPDKGEKLRAALKRLEDELEQEETETSQKEQEADGCEKPTEVKSSSTIGDNSFRQETVASQDHTQSSFSACFYEKMGDTDYRMVDAFDKELSLIKRCDHQKMRHNGEFSRKERKKDSTSSRQLPFQCPSSISKHDLSNGDQRRRANSSFPQPQNEKLSSSCAQMRKNASRVTQSNDSVSRKGETIVLEDEDESHFPERTEQADKLAERMQEARIYYPSRDDPESVELCYMDIDCLAPEGFLTSTIMNFYIRYLQQQASVTDTSISDYHFFNTYFYKKLKEAVSYKGNDRGTFFMKFRRWWKGVNIFEKAYVLIPIHEDLHWSLVIICIPDKEEESGPIILHLDSLGLHSSKSVFDNIRSYMREEWNYLNQEVDSSDLPIAERIWKHLPRRIDDKIIKVPQQKNDYDCGLFVLFFIQRFMEEAPERLKKNDLSMFGKQWFKPQEASGLRGKIRKLLLQEFQNACEVNSLSDALTHEDS